MKTLADLQAKCVNTDVRDRLVNWHGATITSSADCVSWLQADYDQIKSALDAQLQSQIDILNATPSSIDLSPLSEGKYDVYFLGHDVTYAPFQKDFPSGLVVDFTSPTATLLTTNAKDVVSPELNGTVDDPVARVDVTIDGKTYTARNNGDGTWTLPAGTIQPGLTLGMYDVKVVVTDLAGNTSTDTKKLVVTATPPAPITTAGTLQKLAYTGVSILGVVLTAGLLVLGGYVGVTRRRRRMAFSRK